MKTWNITVTTVKGASIGQIGQVHENNESLARAAAAGKFAVEGNRPEGNTSSCIFEDDDFEASPA